MKALSLTLLIFLFASCSFCNGQDSLRSASMNALLKMMRDSGIATMPYGTGYTIAWRDTAQPKYDTVKVIILITDIDIHWRDSSLATGKIVGNGYNFNAFWQYGYSVREIHNESEGVIDWYFDHQRPPNYYGVHKYYLDADKKELPPNIIVWMAKEIEK